MKPKLWLCQAKFSEHINKAQAATTTSYKIREILPKTITFVGNNKLKVCSLVARDTLFHEFKNKIEICNAITEVNFFFKVLSLED
jgi:asparagine synthetase A